jgi:hypothetical protein
MLLPLHGELKSLGELRLVLQYHVHPLVCARPLAILPILSIPAYPILSAICFKFSCYVSTEGRLASADGHLLGSLIQFTQQSYVKVRA